jgi:hypothetical protein
MNDVSRRGLIAGGAGGAGLAVLPPRRPDQQYRPGQGGVSPGARSIIRARQVIVQGRNDGVFIYNGAPALGNLIGSWAAQAGVDAKGNAYPQGLSVTVGAISGGTISGSTITGGTISGTAISASTFDGTDFILNSDGAFFYSGAPANGNLIASIASAAGTDGFGNAYQSGMTTYTGGGSLFATLTANQLQFGISAPLTGALDALVAGISAVGLDLTSGRLASADTPVHARLYTQTNAGHGSPVFFVYQGTTTLGPTTGDLFQVNGSGLFTALLTMANGAAVSGGHDRIERQDGHIGGRP